MKSAGAWWVGLVLAVAMRAAERVPSVPPSQPRLPGSASPVRTLESGDLEIGRVRLLKATREIRFPVQVNQRTGVVEYAVVTNAGKTHESVFRCDAEPQHIQLGLLLLGARPASTNMFPENPAAPVPGEPIQITVLWRQEGTEMSRPLSECIMTVDTLAPLTAGPWVFNGSYLAEGAFVAQREGSIVALYLDPSALINNPRPGRFNDDLHWVNPTNLPPEGVELQVAVRVTAPPAANGAAPRGNASGGAVTKAQPAAPQP